jgi:hypothetical protein
MLFKNPVRTSKRTPQFTITAINWLTLFKEIIAVYSENHTEPINIKCKKELLNVKAAGTYSDHSSLKGYTSLLKSMNSRILHPITVCKVKVTTQTQGQDEVTLHYLDGHSDLHYIVVLGLNPARG